MDFLEMNMELSRATNTRMMINWLELHNTINEVRVKKVYNMKLFLRLQKIQFSIWFSLFSFLSVDKISSK